MSKGIEILAWITIIAGTVITLVGLIIVENTICSTPPAVLYSMCVDPNEVMVVIFGTIVMIGGAAALLSEKFHQKVRIASSSITKRLTASGKSIMIAFLALALASVLLVSSLSLSAAYAIYRTKTPLHVEMEGIKNTYRLGEKIEFTVTLDGYGYDCGFPNVLVEKINSDTTQIEKTIWQLKDIKTGDNNICSLFPVDVPKQAVHIGASQECNPLVVNETGTYIARIEGNIGMVFEIMDESIQNGMLVS